MEEREKCAAALREITANLHRFPPLAAQEGQPWRQRWLIVRGINNVGHHLGAFGYGENVGQCLCSNCLPHRTCAGRRQFLSCLNQLFDLLLDQRAKRTVGFLFGRAVASSAPRKEVRAIAHIQAIGLFPPDKLEILVLSFHLLVENKSSHAGGHLVTAATEFGMREQLTGAFLELTHITVRRARVMAPDVFPNINQILARGVREDKTVHTARRPRPNCRPSSARP
jgi:hypothetical protein